MSLGIYMNQSIVAALLSDKFGFWISCSLRLHHEMHGSVPWVVNHLCHLLCHPYSATSGLNTIPQSLNTAAFMTAYQKVESENDVRMLCSTRPSMLRNTSMPSKDANVNTYLPTLFIKVFVGRDIYSTQSQRGKFIDSKTTEKCQVIEIIDLMKNVMKFNFIFRYHEGNYHNHSINVTNRRIIVPFAVTRVFLRGSYCLIWYWKECPATLNNLIIFKKHLFLLNLFIVLDRQNSEIY